MPEIKNKLNEDGHSPPSDAHERLSRLGTSTKFRGELTCQEDLIIEGTFKGKIESRDHSVRIEKTATVKAEVRAKNIAVLGHLSGNISATDKISIAKDAHMEGDLSGPRISIEEGANFKGSIKMLPAAG